MGDSHIALKIQIYNVLQDFCQGYCGEKCAKKEFGKAEI